MKLRTLFLLAMVWWTLNGLASTAEVLAMRDAAGEPIAFARALQTSMASAWMWVPLTLGLYAVVRRWPIESLRSLKAFFLQAVAVLLVTAIRPVLVVLMNDAVGWYRELPPFSDLLVHSLWNNLFLAWLIIAAAHALLFAERSRQRTRQANELERLLAQERLEALAARLNPHFLFNALNSVAELVQSDPDAAERAIVDLGALLRRSLESNAGRLVPLGEELEFLERYIDIEKLRLGERLVVTWSIDADVASAHVPLFLLQPLVENAIRHGIAQRVAPGGIAVRARRCGDQLVLDVEDGGDGTASGKGLGVGLAGTRARLQAMFGDAHAIDVRAVRDRGTLAQVTLPFRSVSLP